jgi:hypothetical protein
MPSEPIFRDAQAALSAEAVRLALISADQDRQIAEHKRLARALTARLEAAEARAIPVEGTDAWHMAIDAMARAWCKAAGVPFEITMRALTLNCARAALRAALTPPDTETKE